MTKPRLMCRKHLMGEHVEMHMFIGGMRKGISMEGYAENELFEPASLLKRHDDLALEMAARGYRPPALAYRIPPCYAPPCPRI